MKNLRLIQKVHILRYTSLTVYDLRNVIDYELLVNLNMLSLKFYFVLQQYDFGVILFRYLLNLLFYDVVDDYTVDRQWIRFNEFLLWNG